MRSDVSPHAPNMSKLSGCTTSVFAGQCVAGTEGVGDGAPQGGTLLQEVGNFLPLHPNR